jgi:hypothetical protein
MAYLVGVFEGDFDSWKERFDADPLGRKQVARGHTIMRGVENPNQIFLRVEFASAADARAFAEKVRGSDILQALTVTLPPTATEIVDQVTY